MVLSEVQILAGQAMLVVKDVFLVWLAVYVEYLLRGHPGLLSSVFSQFLRVTLVGHRMP